MRVVGEAFAGVGGIVAVTPLVVALHAGCCAPRDDPLADPTPLPARILADEETPLQPVRFPEPKRERTPKEAELIPPPGGDPRARAVVLGQAPVEQAVQRLEDGRLQVGRIIIDRQQGTMFVPGRVNQTEGIIEYMAVGPRGKLHESVLMLDVHPLELQVACILLGIKVASMSEQTDPSLAIVPRGKTEASPAVPRPIEGSLVTLEVSWRVDGKKVTHRAEELAYNRERHKTMEKSPWVYTGSVVFKGVFAAEFDQSFVATWPDRSALFNTPRQTRNPYRGASFGFEANGALLPPKGTSILLTMRRVGPAAPRASTGSLAPTAPARSASAARPPYRSASR